MKKILTIFVFASLIFSLGFVFAAQGINGSGQIGEVVAQGELNGSGTSNSDATALSQRGPPVEGQYRNAEGQVYAMEMSQERMRITAGNFSAQCSEECNMTQEKVQEQTKLHVALSNGKNAEIKVMPDVAAQKALGRLRLKNCVEEEGCVLELKEVEKNDDTSLAYELKRERKAKLLGFIGTNMNVEAQVDAETGEILKTKKPWWAFLASEPEEVEEIA